jgi:hypothetical protein
VEAALPKWPEADQRRSGSLATAVADIALISTTWSVVVGATGIEPVTPSMSTRCSPAELRALKPNDGSGPYIGSKAGRQGCSAGALELSGGLNQAASILFTSLTNSRR